MISDDINKKNNLIEYLKRGLEPELKKVLVSELVDSELALYEKKLRKIIEPLVEKLTINGINNVTDFLNFTENLNISFSWEK